MFFYHEQRATKIVMIMNKKCRPCGKIIAKLDMRQIALKCPVMNAGQKALIIPASENSCTIPVVASQYSVLSTQDFLSNLSEVE